MRIYLIDDDKNIINILKIIIQTRNLGEICGTSNCASDALDDISFIHPDIVIVDLLMPEMDGIAFVEKAHAKLQNTAFIMLSQVSSKDMIANAYEAGVEFYIQKPINSVEVENVITKVSQHLNMQRTLRKMQSIFNDSISPVNTPSRTINNYYSTKLQKILQRLGIVGDNGCKDIITVVEYLIVNQKEIGELTLNELCSYFSDSPKSMEQRIRRTAANGLVNLAHLGLEDYGNEIFIEYSNSLYNFEQVRKEMDFIRGKSDKHGNIKIKNFINALIVACTH